MCWNISANVWEHRQHQSRRCCLQTDLVGTDTRIAGIQRNCGTGSSHCAVLRICNAYTLQQTFTLRNRSNRRSVVFCWSFAASVGWSCAATWCTVCLVISWQGGVFNHHFSGGVSFSCILQQSAMCVPSDFHFAESSRVSSVLMCVHWIQFGVCSALCHETGPLEVAIEFGVNLESESSGFESESPDSESKARLLLWNQCAGNAQTQ